MIRNRVKDWVLLLLCNAIWASQFVMVKLVQTEMGFIFATFFPIAVSTLILAPFALIKKTAAQEAGETRNVGDIWHFLALGILGQVPAQLFVTWGTKLSTASNAALLFLSLPILTTIMALFMLGERLTVTRLIALSLALLGVVESSGIDLSELKLRDEQSFLGNGLIFLSVAGSAFYNVYSKRLMNRYSPHEILLYSYFVVVVILLPVTLTMEPQAFDNLPRFGRVVWAGVGMLAVFQYALSMLLFLQVLERVDAMQAAIMNYLIPFFGVIIGWLMLNEQISASIVWGGILGVASTLFATVLDKSRSARADSRA